MTWNVITAPNMDRRFGLPALPDECIDAIVTDPPAGIAFMGKDWDKNKGGRDQWIDWLFTVMAQCYRVLKPGGHALIWALPRTSHWTATAIEDAQFEIRDVVHHHFGSGFPKSMNVSAAIDKSLKVDRKIVGKNPNHRPESGVNYEGVYAGKNTGAAEMTIAGSAEAAKWEGWQTALKPATEHWILARKPIAKTIANTVLTFGTGALNVAACRIGDESRHNPARELGVNSYGKMERKGDGNHTEGRWPANLILSHGPDCKPIGMKTIRGVDWDGEKGARPGGFVDTGAVKGSSKPSGPLYGDESVTAWDCTIGCPVAEMDRQGGDVDGCGGAVTKEVSPYFQTFRYEPKPSRAERDAGLDAFEASTGGEATDRKEGSKGLSNPRAGAGRSGGSCNTHPTVKGIELMSWLIRLITPPGGVVLDPFCGSGTTGCAAMVEEVDFLGFEMSEKHADIARARIAFWERWEKEQAPLLKAAGVDEKVRFEQLDLVERMQSEAGGRSQDSWNEAEAMAAEIDKSEQGEIL